MASYFKVVCGVLIWAVINGLVVKGTTIAPTILGATMSLVGILLYLPYLLSRPFPKLEKQQKFSLIGLGLSAALNNSFFYTALSLTHVHKAALVHYFASILAVVWISFIPIFKEKLDKVSLISIALGIAGLVIMTGHDWLEHKLWLYFAMLSAVFYSLEMVFSTRSSVIGVDAQYSTFTKLFFQLMIMPIVGFILGQSFAIPTNQYLYIIVAGILLFVSFIFVFSGLKKVPTKHFSVLGYIDRIGAIAIGKFKWGEVFGINVWIGGGLILLAELSILLFKTKKED